jgi:transcriptional regulator with XRE-family HTH domain
LGRKAKGLMHARVAEEVGARIRALRSERGLTLKQLGAECDLSHPFLSQVERGLARPSVATLGAIAEALGTTPAALMTDTRAEPVHVARRGDPDVADPSELPRHVLQAREMTASGGRLIAREVVLETPPDEFSESYAHPGDEFVYVLAGEVEIEIGEERHTLREGDAISYTASIPHRGRAQPGTRILQFTVQA